MSDLLDVYQGLSEKSVSFGGRSVKVYNLADLKNSVDTAALPCRLLLPLGTPTEGRNFGFVALGSSSSITWQLVDMFLYKPVTQGLGLAEAAQALVEYAGNYYDMVRTFRAPTSRTYIQNVTISPGVYEWPRDTGKLYTGVEVLLEVVEVTGG